MAARFFFFKSMIFLIRNFSQNWLIPNKIYFVIDLLYSLNTLLSKMSKCSSHCKKEPLLTKIPEIFNNEINFRNQNFSIAISVWQKKKRKEKDKNLNDSELSSVLKNNLKRLSIIESNKWFKKSKQCRVRKQGFRPFTLITSVIVEMIHLGYAFQHHGTQCFVKFHLSAIIFPKYNYRLIRRLNYL